MLASKALFFAIGLTLFLLALILAVVLAHPRQHTQPAFTPHRVIQAEDVATSVSLPLIRSPSPRPSGPVEVHGYYRKDGTYVREHTRARPH